MTVHGKLPMILVKGVFENPGSYEELEKQQCLPAVHITQEMHLFFPFLT